MHIDGYVTKVAESWLHFLNGSNWIIFWYWEWYSWNVPRPLCIPWSYALWKKENVSYSGMTITRNFKKRSLKESGTNYIFRGIQHLRSLRHCFPYSMVHSCLNLWNRFVCIVFLFCKYNVFYRQIIPYFSVLILWFYSCFLAILPVYSWSLIIYLFQISVPILFLLTQALCPLSITAVVSRTTRRS